VCVPRLSPFVGLLFDRARVPSLEAVTTPPYDAVTPEQEVALRGASPYNLIHVDLVGDRGTDGTRSQQYTAAASELQRWRAEGILVPTDGPAYFPYEMAFVHRARRRRVRGLIATVDIEPWGGDIVPHEETMAAPVEDRLRLMRSVRTDLSSIYAVFGGPCDPLQELLDAATEGPPTLELSDEAGVRHRLWTLRDGPDVAAWLAGEPLLIADGHHRYTMALAYRTEMRAAHGPGPWDRTMMLLVDATEDPPVLPVHRILLAGDPPSSGRPVRDLQEILDEVDDDRPTVGIATRAGGELVHRVLELTGPPPAVCALHAEGLLDPSEGRLRFTPDAVVAENAVRTGEASAAFFLPPTSAERVRAVIEHRRRMPQKSTYFWPKPRTGMVLRAHDADGEVAPADRAPGAPAG
jgi:uncharacterized protein (DUF1015 family)